MKFFPTQLLRFLFIITILTTFVSCFNSSFSKRKYTKGNYNNRVHVYSSNNENGVNQRFKKIVETEKVGGDGEKSISQSALKSNKSNQVDIEFLNSDEPHNTLRSYEAKTNTDSFLKKTIVEKAQKATGKVKSTIDQKKALMPPSSEAKAFGWILFIIGLLMLVISITAMLMTGSSKGCAFVLIAFILMVLGIVIVIES